MKRAIFKVIPRKSEYKEQWSLLIESFPVFGLGKDKPHRKHEPLGRYITTPIFDKNSFWRAMPDSKVWYRPKSEANGIIMFQSQKDLEACSFADKGSDLRQHEYDNQSLYPSEKSKPRKVCSTQRCKWKLQSTG